MFKLSAEAVRHLEAALAFFGDRGHKTNKTELVESAILTLPTTEQQIHDKHRGEKAQPVPPLLSAFRQWKKGELLNRSQLLFLANE